MAGTRSLLRSRVARCPLFHPREQFRRIVHDKFSPLPTSHVARFTRCSASNPAKPSPTRRAFWQLAADPKVRYISVNWVGSNWGRLFLRMLLQKRKSQLPVYTLYRSRVQALVFWGSNCSSLLLRTNKWNGLTFKSFSSWL